MQSAWGEEGRIYPIGYNDMNKETTERNELHWFVMRCRRAEKLERHFQTFNESCKEDDRIEEYFIPALVIRQRKVLPHSDGDGYSHPVSRPGEAASTESNTMRSTLRHFVFLRVRPSAFESICCERWNGGSTRLYHCRDGKGQELVATDSTMRRFMDACLEYGGKFDVITQSRPITEGVTVIVRDGAFKDLEAKVVNVQFQGDGVHFSMAIRLFSNSYAYVHDCRPDDVILRDEDSNVFSAAYLDRIQDSVFSILRLRVNGQETEEMKDADTQQLREYYRLRHATITDPLLSVRFDAMMSICASLTGNKSGKSKYNKLLKRRLKDCEIKDPSAESNSESMAYCLTALFISTRDPKYRSELKSLVSQHMSAGHRLHAVIAIIRKL